MALDEVKGPEIGDMLRRLEAEWIASDFSLDRDQLLAKAKGLLR
jgi:poly(A) polymerase